MNKRTLLLISLIMLGVSCNKEDATPAAPTYVSLSRILLSKKQVAGHDVCFTTIDSGVTSYNWDFGDGHTSTEEAPCHVYADSGMYTVSVFINGNPSLSMSRECYICPEPLFGHLLDGERAWRGYKGVAFSNGTSDTTYQTDTTFAINYLDPTSVVIGSDTLYYRYVRPHNDSILVYGNEYANEYDKVTHKTVRLHHTPSVDSMVFSIWTSISPGGAGFQSYYAP